MPRYWSWFSLSLLEKWIPTDDTFMGIFINGLERTRPNFNRIDMAYIRDIESISIRQWLYASNSSGFVNVWRPKTLILDAVLSEILLSQWTQHNHNSWWRHQMETFSALPAICAGNSPVTGEFPAQGQSRGTLMFSFICAWINGWVNNHEAADVMRHRAHYDVTVMFTEFSFHICNH